MNGWDILIGGGGVLMLVFAFRTATSKKGRCGEKKKKGGSCR